MERVSDKAELFYNLLMVLLSSIYGNQAFAIQCGHRRLLFDFPRTSKKISGATYKCALKLIYSHACYFNKNKEVCHRLCTLSDLR